MQYAITPNMGNTIDNRNIGGAGVIYDKMPTTFQPPISLAYNQLQAIDI